MGTTNKTINYTIIFLLLVVGVMFVPSALIATIPASVSLFVAGKVFKRYEMHYHDAFITAFWAAFCYLAVSMLMSLLLYWRAVYMLDYKIGFYPSWLLNYYTPRHVPDYYKIMSVLHGVSILAAAFILSKKLASKLKQHIPYGYAVLWTMLILLPCLLFGIYGFLFVVRYLCPIQTRTAIEYVLIK
jgi:hypothetical protein